MCVCLLCPDYDRAVIKLIESDDVIHTTYVSARVIRAKCERLLNVNGVYCPPKPIIYYRFQFSVLPC